MKEIKLRDYQKSDIENIELYWQQHNSILYQLPTGGGKSVVISKIIADRKDQRILVFAHKRRLLTQLKQHLSNVGVKAGLLIASTEENLDSNVVIVSIRTAVKDARLERLCERNWDLIVIDEARNSRTNSYDKVLKTIEANNLNIKKLGVDATPYRKDKKRLDEHFDYMVCSSEDTASLIAKGYLAQYKTYVAPIGKIEQEVQEVANDYQQQQLSHYMRQPQYLNYLIETYKKYGQERQAIVFAVDKEHSKAIKKTFIEHGISSVERIDSSLSVEEVENITTSYENKETQILVNVEMLTEGVDLPDTGCIIGARPTKSLTLYLQMVGRGTRLKSDGSDLIVLDCAGWTEAFGQLSSSKHWSLNPEIDPNNPRLNNRVVGKRENGEIVEDLTDFIGEIEELSPEEYLQRIQNGRQRAQEFNEKTNNQIDKLLEAIHTVFVAQIKDIDRYELILINENSKVRNQLGIEYIEKGKQKELWSTCRVRILLEEDKRIYARFHLYDNSPGESERIRELMQMSILEGEINRLLLYSTEVEIKILEIFEQILELKKTKIDLDRFKQAEKTFNKEQFEKEVNDHCATGADFILTKTQCLEDWFKSSKYGNIQSIRVIGNKVNSYSNTIEISWKSRWREEYGKEEKKFIKGEKIFDLLRKGEWRKEGTESNNSL